MDHAESPLETGSSLEAESSLEADVRSAPPLKGPAPGKMLVLMTLAAICGFFVTSTCEAEHEIKEPSTFVLFNNEAKFTGSLQTAIVSYENKSGVRVDLIGAVHIGDSSYYKFLDEKFKEYDALLYELVSDPASRPGDPKREKRKPSFSVISMIQRGMKTALALDFQLDAINYQAKNFVHADMTPWEFQRKQAERGESMLSIMWKGVLQGWKREFQGQGSQMTSQALMEALTNQDSARALKYLLAQELQNVEALMAGLESSEPGKESVILIERNKVALKVLRKELKKGHKRLGIFYGAAHLQDMEERLINEFGFHKTKQVWVTAWDIGGLKPAQESDPNEPKKSAAAEPVVPPAGARRARL